MGDHDMLAHAMLAWTNFETMDYLRNECQVATARLQATWVDLVWGMCLSVAIVSVGRRSA